MTTQVGRHKEVSSAIVPSTHAERLRRAKPKLLSPEYLVGLTDGEGSFCVYIREPTKASWNVRIECHFYIKMREDELPLLKHVKNSFGCGRIAFQKEYRERQRDNYRYQVSNRVELCEIIIPFFERYTLQGINRKRDFRLFVQIVELVNTGAHHDADGLERIRSLKARMHE